MEPTGVDPRGRTAPRHTVLRIEALPPVRRPSPVADTWCNVYHISGGATRSPRPVGREWGLFPFCPGRGGTATVSLPEWPFRGRASALAPAGVIVRSWALRRPITRLPGAGHGHGAAGAGRGETTELVVAATGPSGRSATLEAAHRPAPAFEAAVVLPRSIAPAASGAVADPLARFGPDRAGVAVGRDPVRHRAGRRLRRPDERAGGGRVAALAERHVHERTRAVDGAVDVAPTPARPNGRWCRGGPRSGSSRTRRSPARTGRRRRPPHRS